MTLIVIITIIIFNYSMILNQLILVTGPSRSGKSIWAESLLKDTEHVTYLATLINNKNDKNLCTRIELHKIRRNKKWNIVENKINIIDQIYSIDNTHSILLDSLGGFVSNHIQETEDEWLYTSDLFIKSIKQRTKTVVIVIEECGWGVVPITTAGIIFRDRLGLLAQLLEKISSQSWLTIQGRVLNLKTLGMEI